MPKPKAKRTKAVRAKNKKGLTPFQVYLADLKSALAKANYSSIMSSILPAGKDEADAALGAIAIRLLELETDLVSRIESLERGIKQRSAPVEVPQKAAKRDSSYFIMGAQRALGETPRMEVVAPAQNYARTLEEIKKEKDQVDKELKFVRQQVEIIKAVIAILRDEQIVGTGAEAGAGELEKYLRQTAEEAGMKDYETADLTELLKRLKKAAILMVDAQDVGKASEPPARSNPYAQFFIRVYQVTHDNRKKWKGQSRPPENPLDYLQDLLAFFEMVSHGKILQAGIMEVVLGLKQQLDPFDDEALAKVYRKAAAKAQELGVEVRTGPRGTFLAEDLVALLIKVVEGQNQSASEVPPPIVEALLGDSNDELTVEQAVELIGGIKKLVPSLNGGAA